MQSGSKSLTLLPQYPDLVILLVDRPSKVQNLVELVNCVTSRIRVQHTFERDPPCRSSKLWCLLVFSSRFEHLRVLISFENNFSFSVTIMLCCMLSTPEIFLIKSWRWVFQIDFILQFCPHLRHVLSCSCHLGLFPSFSNQNFLKFFFPTRVHPWCDRKDCAPAVNWTTI